MLPQETHVHVTDFVPIYRHRSVYTQIDKCIIRETHTNSNYSNGVHTLWKCTSTMCTDTIDRHWVVCSNPQNNAQVALNVHGQVDGDVESSRTRVGFHDNCTLPTTRHDPIPPSQHSDMYCQWTGWWWAYGTSNPTMLKNTATKLKQENTKDAMERGAEEWASSTETAVTGAGASEG